jgi:hypothetical protein
LAGSEIPQATKLGCRDSIHFVKRKCQPLRRSRCYYCVCGTPALRYSALSTTDSICVVGREIDAWILPVGRRLLVTSSFRCPRPATHTPHRYVEAALEARPTQGTPRCQLQLSKEAGRCSRPAYGRLLLPRCDRRLEWVDWLRVTSAPESSDLQLSVLRLARLHKRTRIGTGWVRGK